MCVLTTTSDFKRSSFAPLQPLNNGPEPLKWSLMEALMGGGTHSYSIFHPSIPPSLRWLKETATAHKLSAPQGIVTTRRDEAMGNPDYIGSYPPLFLICINTKQEQCGVQTTWRITSRQRLMFRHENRSETQTRLVFTDDHILRQLESVLSLLCLQPSL